jgi:ATP/maltotriose-dependent transcriptional regulator MalT/two-component SAPR family response regulator
MFRLVPMSDNKTASHEISSKIARPRYTSLVPRTRLFRRLDQRSQPIIWLSAPPGAGKTALISSYLDSERLPHLWYRLDGGDADLPTFFEHLQLAAANAFRRDDRSLTRANVEYAPGAAAFARRHFEMLAARIEPPFVLVFDNYHEVRSKAELHAVLRDGLSALPPGFTTIVLSRSDPPAELARQRLNGEVLLLGWDDLRLTPDEVQGIVQLIRGPDASSISHEVLHDKTRGWAGGLVLLLQQDHLDDSKASRSGASQVLFDYFAGEVFADFDAETQRVLAASALLARMPVVCIAALADCPSAGALLQDLSRRNYFTLRHDEAEPIYEYHPLFREFLLARAGQIFEPAELTRLRRKAAALLEADEQVEAAVELLNAAGDSHSIARLILAHASGLITQHGRHDVIEGWLRYLPDEMLAADPWLLYWQGICLLAQSPLRARTHFEQAYARFKSSNDLPGRCHSWCAIVDSVVFEWSDFTPLDGWLDEMSDVLSAKPNLADQSLDAHLACGMFLALMYRHPGHADLLRWEQRVHYLVFHGEDAQLRAKVGNHLLLYYSWWLGDLAKAELLLTMLRTEMEEHPAALHRVTWHAMATAYYLTFVPAEECLIYVNRAIEIAEDHSIHVWDTLLALQGVIAALGVESTDRSSEYLQRMANRLPSSGPMAKAAFYYAFGKLEVTRGKLNSAREAATTSVTMAEKAGAPLFAALLRTDLGAVMAASGARAAGNALIESSRAEARLMRSPMLEYLTCIAGATITIDSADEADHCLEQLRHGLAIAATYRWHKFLWWSAAIMARLYAHALAHGIETEYVTAVIRKRSLAPPKDGVSLEHWPWPLKIYTLGGFRILKHGESLQFTAKSLRKPLELLSALITFGAEDINQSSLIDALWPDLEGDSAQRAFQTALYRLRKLLDDDAAITFRRGRLTLNKERVWVDSISVEQLFRQIDRCAVNATRDVRGMDELADSLLAIYAGDFLPGESSAWAAPRRERLRDQFLSGLQEIAHALEINGDWRAAARCYRRALELEPLMERLSYRLMVCHKELGQTSKAMAVYQRFHQVSTSGGTKPSAEMEALRAALVDAASRAESPRVVRSGTE